MKSVAIDAKNCKWYAQELFVKFHGQKVMIGYNCADCGITGCPHNLKVHGQENIYGLAVLSREDRHYE